MYTIVVLLILFTVSACTTLETPTVDLHAIATPDPVPQTVRLTPQPMPGPKVSQGEWRAWVPRQVSANGDVEEGHWVIISATPPKVEVFEPAMPVPRAPKTPPAFKTPAKKEPAPIPPPPPELPGFPKGASGVLPKALGGLP